MKRISVLMLVFVMSVFLAFTAFAAEVYTPEIDNTFDVVYADATKGEYYVLVAVSGLIDEGGPTISESNIQYIDQQTADEDGVAFTDVLLKNDGRACTLYLGGSDLDDGPILLGHVNVDSSTFILSGTVSSQTQKASTITVYEGEDVVATTTTNASGAYELNLYTGTYKFVVTAPAHLSYTKNTLEFTQDTVKDVTLLGGDVVVDGEVGGMDLNTLITNLNTTNASADVNGDNEVGGMDLNILITNLNKTATVE